MIFLAVISGYNSKFTIPIIFMFGIYTILWGYASKDWHWLVALWIFQVLIGIVAVINLVAKSGQWVKALEFIFIVFYIGNFFVMNNLV